MSVESSFFNMQNEFNALESQVENVKNTINGAYLRTQNYLIINQTLTATITNYFMSNILTGSYEYGRPQYSLNVYIQKTFLDGRLIFNLSSEDVFNTMNIPLTSRYSNQNNSFFAMPESQKIRVGLRYKFGNFKLRDNSRATSAEEETRLETNY